MQGFSLYSDQRVRQEQYKELRRESENHRLVKVEARSRPKVLQELIVTVRRAVDGLSRQPSMPLANES